MARKIILHPKKQRLLLAFVDVGFIYIWLASIAMLVYYFASMNLKGLLNISLVLLGAHIGYTSLLFNRARAYDDGAIKRRTLVAAEIGLRATMLFLAVFILGAFAFSMLSNLGFGETVMDWNMRKPFANAAIEPTVVAFVFVFLLQFSFLALHSSVIILIRRNFGFFVDKSIFVKRANR